MMFDLQLFMDQVLKGKSEDLKDISKDLDVILRKLLMEDSGIFSKNDNELEDFHGFALLK